MNFKFITPVLCVLSTLVPFNVANATQWTLQSSISQAMLLSPEIKKSTAEIGARSADVKLSSIWPDPNIEFKIDNNIGQDDGSGDYGLSEITISQDIPLSRIKHQKLVAEANLSAAMYSQSNATLQLQNRVARVFYELQLASATFELAIKRVKLADKLNASALKNNQGTVVRYLTPLEKMRLSIIREQAHQAESAAEGKLQEVLTEFYTIVGIDTSNRVSVPELLPLNSLPELDGLIESQNKHPLLSSQQQQLMAASNSVELARSSSMRDPSVSINKLRDNFSSGTEDVYGLMLNIEIPIHDRKSNAVSKANYAASQQRIELARLKRELQLNLKQSFTHLNHIIEQASEFKKKVLLPANKILQLSEKGFISGELNILSLVEANNTYFESQTHYLDLIYQAWTEHADIHLYAGQPLINASLSENTYSKGVQ